MSVIVVIQRARWYPDPAFLYAEKANTRIVCVVNITTHEANAQIPHVVNLTTDEVITQIASVVNIKKAMCHPRPHITTKASSAAAPLLHIP